MYAHQMTGRAKCDCGKPASVKRGNAFICQRCADIDSRATQRECSGQGRLEHIYATVGDHRKPKR